MDLSSKYLIGFAILGAFSLVYFILIPFSPLIAYFYFDFSPLYLGTLLLIIGISIFGTGVVFYVLLYSSERIKGFRAEYEISPDLTKFKAIPYAEKTINQQEEKIPDTAFCSSCGKQVFNPFKCAKCGQILCGKHYLPGEHICLEGKS